MAIVFFKSELLENEDESIILINATASKKEAEVVGKR